MKRRMLAILLVSCLLTACGSRQAEAAEAPAATETVSSLHVMPLPCTVDLTQLDHCRLDISLEEGSLITENGGKLQMHLTVYIYDKYDPVDISRMKPGDTIYINGQDLRIASLEETDYGSVRINGGLENGGHELRTDGNGVYFETGYSDVKSYYAIGSVTLPVSSDFAYVDASDLDQDETLRPLEELISEHTEHASWFRPGSTSILVENGVITSLTRIYVP